jgi:anti-anti-sigma factor
MVREASFQLLLSLRKKADDVDHTVRIDYFVQRLMSSSGSSARILVAHHNGVAWLRVEGRGSFQNSCELKDFARGRLDAGDSIVLVDLEECTYMDSTFMGTLTGIACRLESESGKQLEIVNPSPRARELLENLGLDQILRIHQVDEGVNGMDWASIRGVMAEQLFPESFTDIGEAKLKKAEVLLEAHKALSACNSKNDVRFRDVILLVEKELQAQH